MKCVNGDHAIAGPAEKNPLPSKDDLEERKSAPQNTSADTTNFSSSLQSTSAQKQPSSTFAPYQPSFSQHQPQTTFGQHQPQNSVNQHHPSTSYNQQLPMATFNQQQPATSFLQQTLQVPHPPGRPPSVPVSARRGTNIAVSKRTRFALQVQKSTGEESSQSLD